MIFRFFHLRRGLFIKIGIIRPYLETNSLFLSFKYPDERILFWNRSEMFSAFDCITTYLYFKVVRNKEWKNAH